MGALLLFIFIAAITFGVIVLYSFLKGISRDFVRTGEQRGSFFNNNKYTHNKSSKHQKVFNRNEGRYIQYEEIQD